MAATRKQLGRATRTHSLFSSWKGRFRNKNNANRERMVDQSEVDNSRLFQTLSALDERGPSRRKFVSLHCSQDGTEIAFVSDRIGDFDVWVMDGDETNQTSLTDASGSDTRTHWLPDATKITFVSDPSGNSEVWVMDADGSNQPNVIINSTGEDTDPHWRPEER